MQHKDMLQLMIDAASTGEEQKEIISAASGDERCGCPFQKKIPVPGKLIMNDKDISGHAQVLLLAGYETTANALVFTTYLLALNPDIQEKLQSEIDGYFGENPVSQFQLWHS
jgi:cytochrome P450